MQNITPCLWFDDEAEQAAAFYVSVFKDAEIGGITRYTAETPSDKPLGSVLTVDFTLEGREFMALNGGPVFRFTPAISFFVNRQSAEEVETLWDKLSEGGTVLVELDSFPFSEKFGWCMDRFGVSWQVNLCADAPQIAPFLLFVGPQHGRAEEAVGFYTRVFRESAIESIVYYGPDEPEPEGTLRHAAFTLGGQNFMAMDSGLDHPFTFNEAVSLVARCEDQQEIDRLWAALVADGGEEVQCGWLKDKYGVSWQIVPTALQAMLRDADTAKAARVLEALLEMKKLDLAALERAFAGA